MIMKAVILAGGEGTRLRPLTCNTPKAIVPILNKPFLEHLLRYLSEHGVQDVILATGYIPDQIESCLGDGSQMGVRMTYSVEKSPLGTAGAVKNAESLLDETFIVLNGDILTSIDLTAMIKWHREIKPKASIALTPVDNPTIYGVVETDVVGMVKRFVEKPKQDEVTTNMINAGIYILEPEVLSLVPPSTKSMFERQVFPQLLERGEPVFGYPSDVYWIDIGTPEKYLQANHDLLLEWGKDIRTEGESKIHPTARIEGPVLIGRDCVISSGAQIKGPAVLGPGCVIGEGAVIDRAVLWHDVKVGEKAVIRNCIACAHSRIDGLSQVPDNCILSENTTVSQGKQLEPGDCLWPEGFSEQNTRDS